MGSNVVLVKLSPMIAVVGVVGWLIWPFVDAAVTPQLSKSEATQIDLGLFNPVLKKASGRNPFVPLGAAGDESAGRPEDEDGARPELAQPGPGASSPGEIAVEANPSGAQGPPSGWILGATLVHGGRRAAVINGRVYLLGELVASTIPDAGPLRLDRIERDMVFLGEKDRPRPIVLAYAGAGLPHAPPKPAPRRDPAGDPVGGGVDLARLLGSGGAVPILDMIRSLGLGGLVH